MSASRMGWRARLSARMLGLIALLVPRERREQFKTDATCTWVQAFSEGKVESTELSSIEIATADYRARRQKQILDYYDRWRIAETQVTLSVGGEPATKYVPHQLWDDEWQLAAPMFDSYREAVDHVYSHDGVLASS